MKVTHFEKTKPIDRTDPGFRIKGLKLRWVGGKVSESNPGRVWTPLRLDDLPKELLEHVKQYSYHLITDGSTLRRGDLVLSYATEEIANEYRKDILNNSREQERRIKVAPTSRDSRGRQNISVTESEQKDVTAEMIARFKASREEK